MRSFFLSLTGSESHGVLSSGNHSGVGEHWNTSPPRRAVPQSGGAEKRRRRREVRQGEDTVRGHGMVFKTPFWNLSSANLVKLALINMSCIPFP